MMECDLRGVLHEESEVRCELRDTQTFLFELNLI
jgi:hypothetical protein